MEVLLGDEPFASLIEEYMGPDSRRYFELLIDTCEARGYDKGYDDGYRDGQT